MANPAGATNYIDITANHLQVAASMPDVTNTFAADLVIDQAAAVNYEGGAETFIDGLAASCTDLRVYNSDASVEIPFGVLHFSQTVGSRKLFLRLGIPSAAPLLSASDTKYRLYRGCTGGTFENWAGVVPTADGYVADWSLSEGTGAAIADNTANSLDLTLAPTDHWTTGKIGNAYAFDGTDDSARITDNAAFDLANVTVSAWVKTSDVSDYNSIVQAFHFGNKDGWALSVRKTSGRGGFEICDGTNNVQCLSSGAITDGAWHHLVGVYDGAYVRLYVDSSAATPTANSNGIAYGDPTPLAVAWRPDSTLRYLAATIDEVRVESVVRSANWIRTIYEIQSDNGAFWTVGAEKSVGGGGLPLLATRLGRVGPSIAGVR